MAKAQNLREAIYHLIEQTNNDLKVQQDATNFDFRKRMYEMKRAKEELEYQIKKVNRGTFNGETNCKWSTIEHNAVNTVVKKTQVLT